MSVPTLIPGPVGEVQNLSYSGTHATSTKIAANEAPGRTITVRLSATSNCYYTVDGTTATSSNGAYLPASIIEYIRLANNAIIDVVQATASGTLNIVPMHDVSTP